MSDLVKRVAIRMCSDAGYDPFDIGPNDGPRWMYYEPQARAAIAAVAEWLRQELSVDEHEPYVAAALMKQLEQPK